MLLVYIVNRNFVYECLKFYLNWIVNKEIADHILMGKKIEIWHHGARSHVRSELERGIFHRVASRCFCVWQLLVSCHKIRSSLCRDSSKNGAKHANIIARSYKKNTKDIKNNFQDVIDQLRDHHLAQTFSLSKTKTIAFVCQFKNNFLLALWISHFFLVYIYRRTSNFCPLFLYIISTFKVSNPIYSHLYSAFSQLYECLNPLSYYN